MPDTDLSEGAGRPVDGEHGAHKVLGDGHQVGRQLQHAGRVVVLLDDHLAVRLRGVAQPRGRRHWSEGEIQVYYIQNEKSRWSQ